MLVDLTDQHKGRIETFLEDAWGNLQELFDKKNISEEGKQERIQKEIMPEERFSQPIIRFNVFVTDSTIQFYEYRVWALLHPSKQASGYILNLLGLVQPYSNNPEEAKRAVEIFSEQYLKQLISQPKESEEDSETSHCTIL